MHCKSKSIDLKMARAIEKWEDNGNDFLLKKKKILQRPQRIIGVMCQHCLVKKKGVQLLWHYPVKRVFSFNLGYFVSEKINIANQLNNLV